MQSVSRLRELDFLRGIAILLVFFRHQYLFDFLKTIGWIGVDLFFVISGFLVSGLLFKEYRRFGSVNAKLFLIRRGFKIYPIFYLSYVLYVIPRVLMNKLDLEKVFYELTFTQNYALGWGYAYSASWSLAVEEHFYFGLALLLWLIFNKRIMRFEMVPNRFTLFEKSIVAILIIVLGMRLWANIDVIENEALHITMTHLRIDSLLFGVLLSYWYYFRKEQLTELFKKNQSILMIAALLMLSFTPFYDLMTSYFVKTVGFTLLYLAFGIVLLYFLLNENINHRLNRLFSARVVDFVSKIGYCSYSIYIIHTFVILYCDAFLAPINPYLLTVITFTITMISGFIMTFKIEKLFLNYRDKYYPSRTI
ncbi:acyltransferase family protein [Flavobacterium terrisoli]|uniref:acyltransferase family protein n=1 Tax=Flavobacterium terrisoli TaxID=3242195 RepID=UPI002542BE22|nr:acyltransferase [Flavobacterium buctense]